MKLYKKIEWPVFDLGVFKITMLAIGLLAGAYFVDFVNQYALVIGIIAVVGCARVFYFYFIKNK